MNKLISFLSILAIPTVLFAATITNEPTGTGNWGDGANWIGGVEPSNGDSVYIIAAGGYAPTNIDILDLEINTLFITNSDNITMVFTGNDLKLWGIRGLARSTVTVATNVIQNNLTFMNASQGWALGNNNIIIFEGVIGATNPAYRAGGDTGALPSKYVLRNTNTFAGGIGSNLSRYEIYSDANFGLVPAAPVDNYLNNNYGSWTFSSLPGTCNKIVVHQNRGYRTSNGCTVYLDNNTKVVYKGVISDIGNNGWTRSGPGYLMLLYSNVFGGNMGSTPTPGGFGSMTRAMSDFAFGTPTANRYIRSADGNAYDFNGFRVSKDLYWYNGSANGAFRNCNVDCCSTVTSARILFNYGGTYVNTFSGPGDMLLTGNIITNPGSGMQLGVVFKAGSGTLTYQGVTAITNATSVRGGKMVYDYTVNNGRKLAALLDMTNGLGVRAAIEFIGNDSEDTTEAVTDIDPADNVVPSNIRASYGAGSITIRTGVGRNFTLLARRITRAGQYDGANPLDITLENNGGGVAQVLVSAQGDGVLGGFHTFNKSTWMKISGGAVTGLADGEYDTAFWGDLSGTNKNVDVTADTTIESNA
ncbi:hypothetical protein GX586_07395, partial [bacterium]|nr:hypothetical protein [bacterium]